MNKYKTTNISKHLIDRFQPVCLKIRAWVTNSRLTRSCVNVQEVGAVIWTIAPGKQNLEIQRKWSFEIMVPHRRCLPLQDDASEGVIANCLHFVYNKAKVSPGGNITYCHILPRIGKIWEILLLDKPARLSFSFSLDLLLNDINQTNINRDIRDGNWLSTTALNFCNDFVLWVNNFVLLVNFSQF